MYRLSIEEAQSQRLQNDATSKVEQCTSVQDMDDKQLVGVNSPVMENVIGSGEKTKRGRPPRGAATKAPPRKRQREEEDGEDVCFICFDGGSLVLCDCKGCPKAYHPACIKRDEAFFRSKAKWNCDCKLHGTLPNFTMPDSLNSIDLSANFRGWYIKFQACKRMLSNKTSNFFEAINASNNQLFGNIPKFFGGLNSEITTNGNQRWPPSNNLRTWPENVFRRRTNFSPVPYSSPFPKFMAMLGVAVQVDFDDKNNWEYLFKVYWMYLKEKLSLTQSELIQAKNPWKGSDAVHAKQQRLPFGHPVASDGKGIASKSFDHLELKKPKQLLEPPCKDPPIAEIQTIAEAENLSAPGCTPQLEQTQRIELELRSKDSLRTEEASTATATSLNGRKEWASKELLEFVAHMKNGDTSALSHFEVQALLLEYIKRNKLRDPHQKSQIICDSRLRSIFGKHRAGHIEMLKLLEYHFLIKEGSQRSAVIPAGIVGTVTNRVEADSNNDISFLINKTKKRKSRRHTEESLVQINLDEYAAIDAHNINLIYLRRDLMESLIEDMEKFQGRVIGSVVRIRISGNNQKQDMYRLVHVVGTSKAFVPYKIGDKTADVLLEVLNLNKKEVVPIDSISNQDFSEVTGVDIDDLSNHLLAFLQDECRRLRQIIKCGLVKRLTIGEIQKKAIELRAVKLSDILSMGTRTSLTLPTLRECVEKLELLKTPEEHQRRLLAIPEVHADPKMDPNYETEEDARECDDKKQVEFGGPRYTRFSRREDTLMSSWRKDKEGSIMARCKVSEKREAQGNIMKKLGNQGTAFQAVDRSSSETSITSFSTVNSTSTNNSETDKLWHYRDPSGKIQGPFSVTQLRKWNTSGLFPLDMRIWTTDERDDSVLLTNALNGLFHKAPQVLGEISHQSQELDAASVNSSIRWCESAAGTGRECGEREVPRHLCITNNHSNGNIETARMDGLSSSSPQCLDLNNSYSDKPHPSSPAPSSSHGNVRGAPPHEIVDFQSSTGHRVQDSSGSTMSQISDGCNHSMQYHSQSHLGQSSGQNWGSSNSNRSSVNINSGSRFASVTKSSDSFEQKGITSYPDLPSPTPNTSYDDVEAQVAEELLSLSSVVPVYSSDIQDLPSPTPKLEDEAPVGQAAANKESLTSSFPVQDSGPSWSSASSLVIDGAQLPEMANGLGGYSPAVKSSIDSDSALKPAEAVGDHVDTPTSDANQLNHNSSSHPILNFSDCRAIFGDPIEFSTLDEESVSDLLAEVDAMESQTQSGMGSPTSAMRCSEETISVCKSDFFSFFEEFSPTPDPAKNDALGSTEDVQLPCQSSLTDELAGTSQAEAFDPLKRSSRTSSPSSEGETKSADVSFSLGEAGSNVPTPYTTKKTAVPVISQSTGLEAITTDCRVAPGNMTCGGPVQGFPNVSQGSSMVTARGRSSTNHCPSTGNPLSESQCIYSGERSGGPRDWVIPVGDSGIWKG
ncbi:hypothetical protein RND71_019472 [Anisodus tanguticus]|uniref:Zinc finger CCCH domain-containing protein 44-like n=1 Tax=Anisodus tanguticus TaxID=243964 RepID=A0AAE1VHG6_9SOLA|nr:hypothetical protein RND71_019472 [Anisodus tanguticus]